MAAGTNAATLPNSLPFSLVVALFVVLIWTPLTWAKKPSVTPGEWVIQQKSIGVSAMHMQLMNDNKVVVYDRTNFGHSNLTLPNGRCRHNEYELVLKVDCTAHSVLYDAVSNTFRALFVQTDTWCSSGSVNINGTLVQAGGFNEGERIVRNFTPCPDGDDTCDWVEFPGTLSDRRWYATSAILPDGRTIIIGGRSAFSYEFVPRLTPNETSFNFKFLVETHDFNEENNLYPFVHLLPDGNLFIFANTKSISFDYKTNTVVRRFPDIPGVDKRNYPSTGSSVLLPLKLAGVDVAAWKLPAVEVLICGGAPNGSFFESLKGNFLEASWTCGRLNVSDPNPTWAMEVMPMPRAIADMILLPTGDVLIVNGAKNGTAGWEGADVPALNPVLYVTDKSDTDQRFVTLAASTIPRMYHSAAVLLADGRVMVGGSNPHAFYNFTTTFYPTQLSLETFSPYYLSEDNAPLRPTAVSVGAAVVSYGKELKVNFTVPEFESEKDVYVTMVRPSFTTHSFAMNQRLLVLDVVDFDQPLPSVLVITVRTPPTAEIAPAGYYMLFVVHSGVPSPGVWVKLQW